MPNRVFQPKNLDTLREAMSNGHSGSGAGKDKLVFAAGCTDLMIRLRANPPEGIVVIDLSKMDSLKKCALEEDGLKIGALCTMTALSESPVVRQNAGILACAASKVGSTQIRNRATIGGNVANAAQCADTIPALIALEAEVELMDSTGALRRLPVEAFVTGIGRTRLGADEVVTGFVIPPQHLALPGGYCKIGAREAVTIAKINCAGIFQFGEAGVNSARIAFGSLGQRGFFSDHVSAGLTGMTFEMLEKGAYLELFEKQVELAIPGRDSLAYKRSAVKAVAASIVEQALAAVRG